MRSGLWGVLLQLATQAGQDMPAAPARTLREARDAQAHFERVRRMNLPMERGGSAGRCDRRIGRFCYWYDSSDAAAPPEPHRIVAARDRLLETLAAAARAHPADAWIAGQRVRYLLEASRGPEAQHAARACRAESWWCAALLGLSLHADRRYAESDTAFSLALRTMPPEMRCQWMDIGRLVNRALAREMGRASCDERARLSQTLWRLSAPLWSAPDNDLRTEHLSRRTYAIIMEESANAHGLAWGADNRELLVRYGWASWYTRREPPVGWSAGPETIGHDREPSYAFLPDLRSARGLPWIAPESWNLRAPLAEHRYAPRHVTRFVELSHQLARFPRGDSMLVAVGLAVSDSALRGDSTRTWLIALDSAWRFHAGDGDGNAAALVARAETLVVSIEVTGMRTGRAARARYSVAPLDCPTAFCVSDLLLLRSTTRPRDADDAARHALVGETSAAAPLGVFWEVHASAATEPVRMTLQVERIGVGLARRLAAALRLAQLPAPVRLHWNAATTSARAEFITLRLLPGARGRHRIVLQVQRGTTVMTRAREVDVRG